MASAWFADCRHPDGAARLERLQRDNSFLILLDDRRIWFAITTCSWMCCVRAEQPELALRLHQRASAWYAQQGLTAEIPAAKVLEDAVLSSQAMLAAQICRLLEM